jgi:RND family efflux transporter MFP subunit
MASSPRRSTDNPSLPHPENRRGDVAVILVFAGVVVAALFVGWLMMGTDFGSMILGSGSNSEKDGTQLYEVRRETLRVTVTEDGNLESADNTEVKCEIPGGSTILKIIDEGTTVAEGDELVRLDESAIEDARDLQSGVVDEAKAAKVQAEQNVIAAEIAVKEYEKGTFIQAQQIAEANIVISLENEATSKNFLDHSKKMFRKGFATQLQVDSDTFAVRRAGLERAAAETALNVLEEFTKTKMMTELNATRDAAVALKEAKVNALVLEVKKLTRLNDKLDKAVIRAPKAGMVIYANERSRYSSVTIELHSAVKEGQSIIRLPDLSKMEAKVLVNESKIELLKIDAFAQLKIGDRSFRGTVKSIANQPERGSFGSDVKEYATIVSIEGSAKGLKPGMTAEVEILVDEFENVLTVPVSAVVEKRGKYFCWVATDAKKPEQRELILFGTNDRKMAISDGVKVGDKVILNPRATVPEAREEAKKSDDKDGGGDRGGEWGNGKSAGDKPRSKPGEKGRPSAGPSSGGSEKSGRPAGGPPAGAGSGQKPYEDKNGDGNISKDEVSSWMVNAFDRVDGNGDGVLDKDELKKMAERRKSAGGSR